MSNEAVLENVEGQTQEATRTITANSDPKIDIKEVKFGFRKIKDEETGVETKRPTVETKLPVPSVEGIIAILEAGGKQLELLQQAVQNTIEDAVKSRLSEDTSITSDNFPYADFTWEAIANQPESERRGRGIAKEVWEDFFKDYIASMPALTGKTAKQVEKQAAVLAQKLNPLKNHEDKDTLLPKFKDQLTIYLNGSKQAENFGECVDFLMKKADSLLTQEKNTNLAENLGF